MADASPSTPSAQGEANEQTTPTSAPRPTNKAQAQAAQMKKLHEANTKYKNLLKMAKERIQQQEEELEKLRGKLRGCSTVFSCGPSDIFSYTMVLINTYYVKVN